MKYDISLSDDGTYVRVRVFAAITAELEREFAQQAIETAKQHGVRKFLVDVRGTPNVASAVEQYAFGFEEMDQFALDKSSKIAAVVDADDRSHDFIEAVLVNAAYNIRLFSSEDAALKWLEE